MNKELRDKPRFIDITLEQHQHLKAAALQGKSIKSYVLERSLPAADEQVALKELEDFLTPRIEMAKQGVVINESVDDIFNEALAQLK